MAGVASLATAAGAVILLGGLVRAALALHEAARTFAASVVLALEFLLAAGLLRLGATMTFTGLAIVIGVIATRRVVGVGLRQLKSDG